MRQDADVEDADDRRRSFEVYLRTGRRIAAGDAAIDFELKFNPWHDPQDGRFTYAGTGRYFAPGGGWMDGGFTGGGRGSAGGGGATGHGIWPDPKRFPEKPTARSGVGPSAGVAIRPKRPTHTKSC